MNLVGAYPFICLELNILSDLIHTHTRSLAEHFYHGWFHFRMLSHFLAPMELKKCKLPYVCIWSYFDFCFMKGLAYTISYADSYAVTMLLAMMLELCC